jgi:hypothetical protein
VCAAATAEHKTEAPGLNLMKWLKDNGAPQDKVELRTLEVPAAGTKQQQLLLCFGVLATS